MATEQDNSQQHFFWWTSTNGSTFSGNEDTSLYVDSGISMVTFKNNLVLAAKQDNSQDHVFIFSSPNGSTWDAEQYSEIMTNNTVPALGLYDSGVTLGYVLNGNVYTAFATQ
jgi:hypothetical protein